MFADDTTGLAGCNNLPELFTQVSTEIKIDSSLVSHQQDEFVVFHVLRQKNINPTLKEPNEHKSNLVYELEWNYNGHELSENRSYVCWTLEGLV
jgi:hypothetical protein